MTELVARKATSGREVTMSKESALVEARVIHIHDISSMATSLLDRESFTRTEERLVILTRDMHDVCEVDSNPRNFRNTKLTRVDRGEGLSELEARRRLEDVQHDHHGKIGRNRMADLETQVYTSND
jgi:hypothetical protein